LKIFGLELKFNGFNIWHSGNDGSGSGLDADLLDGNESSVFAKLSSPAFTGTPTTTTPATGDNSTRIASTAFVQNSLGVVGAGDMTKAVYDTNNDGIVNKADTATKLETARNINGVAFDGTKDINLTANQIGSFPVSSLSNTQTDLNTIFNDGKYYCSAWTNYPSDAVDSQGSLIVVNYAGNSSGGSWVLQILSNPSQDSVWSRKHRGSTWDNWSKIIGSILSDNLTTGSNFSSISADLKYIPRDNYTTINNANYGIPYVTTCSDGSQIGLAGYWWHIMYFRHLDNNGFGAQLAIALNGGNSMYFRTSSGTTWSGWSQMYSSANILRSTGTPSGYGDGAIWHTYS